MGEAKEHELDWWVVGLKIRVVYFASAREATATQRETFTIPDAASTSDLAKEMIKRHPALDRMLDSVRFSVNLEVVEGRRSLHDGDEVGVLPPLAGG